jgi:hypothetical protein
VLLATLLEEGGVDNDEEGGEDKEGRPFFSLFT